MTQSSRRNAAGPQPEFGWVYCLRNPAMPGLLKIGYTNRSVEVRIRELSFGAKGTYATGVPMPFERVKEWRIMSGETRQIEQLLHAHLSRYRLPAPAGYKMQKEFFRLDEATCTALVDAKLSDLGLLALADADEQQAAAHAERLRTHRAERNAQAVRDAAFAAAVSTAKRQATQAARKRFEPQEHQRALNIAIGTFVGCAALLALSGRNKPGAYLFAAIVAFFAYFFNFGGLGRKYLSSPEFQRELDTIRASIESAHGLAPDPRPFEPRGPTRAPLAAVDVVAPPTPAPPTPHEVFQVPSGRATSRVLRRCPHCWAVNVQAVTVETTQRLSCPDCRQSFLQSDAIKG